MINHVVDDAAVIDRYHCPQQVSCGFQKTMFKSHPCESCTVVGRIVPFGL
jgi:hypothetical protein